jgi:hypothetical protein
LAWHLLTPQPWPFGATEADIPWDFTPQFFNAIVPIITPPKPATSMASVAFPVPQPAWVSLVAYGLLGLGSLALAVAWAYAERRNAPWVAIAVAGFVLPGAYALYYPWGTPDRLRFFPIFESHARAWMALDGFAGGEPITVVYAGTNLPYYTFGPDLANRVRAVNINAHPDWLMHDYHRAWSAKGWPLWGNPRPGWDRIEPDESAWLANLRAAGADYLFVGRPGVVEGPHLLADAEGFPIERIWADRRPGVFTRVYPLPDQRIDDPHVRIYRISKPALQAMTL